MSVGEANYGAGLYSAERRRALRLTVRKHGLDPLWYVHIHGYGGARIFLSRWVTREQARKHAREMRRAIRGGRSK